MSYYGLLISASEFTGRRVGDAWKSGRRSICGAENASASSRGITAGKRSSATTRAAMARHWVDWGPNCLHLVDLDGAREGRPVNLASVRAIVEAVGIPCELGGGIRDEESSANCWTWGSPGW